MEISKDLLERLLKESHEFKKAYELHSDYDKQVAEIDRKSYLTSDEEVDRKRLQKLKLAQKDKIEEIVARYKQ